ncbi:hypothetical protein PHISCL_05084 [Aspergillus sclerotialis]|uniref:STEEP1 domain-containing protein n=1 Tax=Aspergillus sclerotialis TaxID=2070753 RepID=A0A3A2ZJU0_9EURO|nr:hypothetical protein PHISCL_05084 [Aspergillus sclerotialis]
MASLPAATAAPPPTSQDPQAHSEQGQEQSTSLPTSTPKARLPVRTYHCRFCNHLLLASTRELSRLPRRKEPAKDAALILPLPAPKSEDADNIPEDEVEEDEAQNGNENEDDTKDDTENTNTDTNNSTPLPRKSNRKQQQHSTLLLSTTLPDRKPTLVRREDGIEKRLFLRCGRCRVVVGYFLDPVHFPGSSGLEEKAKVVYLLPGGMMETHVMGDEEGMRVLDREWRGWI